MGRSKVVLQNPKYLQNLGASIRACACWGAESLTYTGARIQRDPDRLPREFRMKEYRHIEVRQSERPFDLFPSFVPICVEVGQGQPIQTFQHPENALYVFGPEDSEVSVVFRRHCHYFIHLPSKFCLNLAACVNVVLYDRYLKEH